VGEACEPIDPIDFHFQVKLADIRPVNADQEHFSSDTSINPSSTKRGDNENHRHSSEIPTSVVVFTSKRWLNEDHMLVTDTPSFMKRHVRA
jgi:hypothetical protein